MDIGCSMDGAIEQFGDDEMMGSSYKRSLRRVSTPKKAIAAKAASTAKTAKVTKVAAKQVAQSSAPSKVKREAASIASAAESLAQRAKKLSAMAGVEPVLMGDAGDFYNIGSMQMGAIEQFSGDADFGAIEQFSGQDDGMMGGPIDVVVKNWPWALAAAVVGIIVWKKSKK